MDRPAGTLRPPPLQQTIADEKGRFVFWPLEPGSGYFVNASAFGYFDGGYGRREGEYAGRRVSLADRQWFDRADIGMRRPGAVSGRVLDEHGDPVVGVMVRVVRQVHVAGRAQLASGPNVTTDDRGAYRFPDLVPGRYFVVVPSIQMAAPVSVVAPLAAKLDPVDASSRISPQTTLDPMIDLDGVNRLVVGRFATPPHARDGRPMAYPVSWHPGVATVPTAAPIDLDFGLERTGVDVRLDPVPTVRVSGAVQGAEIAPGLTLRLLPSGSEALGLGSEAATALVAGDGSFTFLNVPAGEYVIDARGTITEYEINAGSARYNLPLPPGTRSTGGSAMSLSSGTPGTGMTTIRLGAGDRFWGRLPIAVGDRDVSNLTLTLHATIAIRGRLVYEGKTRAPAFLFIAAEPADGNAALGQSLNSIRQSDTGEFLIEGLLPGSYMLRVRGTGDWTVKSIVSEARDYANAPFDTAAGRDFTDVTITLTDQVPILEGAVTDALGRPIAGAAVIAFPAEREQWSGYGLTPLRIKTARVNTQGSYRLTGLPAGEYLLVAVDEGSADAWHDPAFFEAAAPRASRVALAWGQRAAQNLRTVEGRTR